LEQTIDAWTATGSGLLNATDASLSSQIARLEKRATGMESRLELRRTALLHQFAAMEAMVGKFQMQAGSLGTQLSGIRSAFSS
jgi:flagellar capping protein FliD